MPDYLIYGACLRCDVTIPELRTIHDALPRWTLRAIERASALEHSRTLGTAELTPTTSVRVVKHARGFRLEYDDTGSYDVSADGRTIAWCAGPEPTPSAVRADICGRVLSTALHAMGFLCLHGSAVTMGDGVVAFLAPKYHGKSTLALALARAGCRLVTDDVLPVEIGDPPIALPGVHQVKLWDDSAEHFGLAGRDRGAGEKHLLHDFGDERLMFERAPLRAIYLLTPIIERAADEPLVQRTRVSDVPAALALVWQTVLGALLGGEEAGAIFERAADVARHVPVYQLRVVAGMDHLAEVVAELRRWHDGERVSAAALEPLR